MPRRSRHLIAVLAAVLLLGSSATPAAAVKGTATMIRALNKQRSQNGIPAGIKQRKKWSRDCLEHDKWMYRNGTVAHYEDPGSPGYSKGGNWAAGNAVLAAGVYPFTTPVNNPYLNAPYHLAQLLNPRLDVMGAAWLGSFDCETTLPGYRRHHPQKDRVWSFPGDHASIPWFENAQELGSVPGDSVGLPQGTYTGPNMIAFTDGPQKPAPLTDLRKASLAGPDGKVATRVVDDRNGSALPGTGFVIPVDPLSPATQYTAHVTFGGHGAGRTAKRTWTFTTDPLLTGSAAVSFHVARDGSKVSISLWEHDEAYLGRRAKVSGQSSRGYTIQPFELDIGSRTTGTEALTLSMQQGETIDFKADIQPFHIGDTHVKGFEITRTVSSP